VVVLINPNLVVQRSDPFTTGIVYMPIGLAYVAAALRRAGDPPKVIDAFARKPSQTRREGGFLLLGLTCTEILEDIPRDAAAVFVYAINLTNHLSTEAIIRAVKRARPELPVVVLENTQAVTAYALRVVAAQLYAAGADYVLTGEGEERAVLLAQALTENSSARLHTMDGLGSPEFFNPPVADIVDLDGLPFPAWDLFPLQNYWSLRFAHGPQSTSRYLPILTSRGCPYPCTFCVVPATNGHRWRPRSAANVVDEMEQAVRQYGVREFHLEDLDPTISDPRIRNICQEIGRRRLDVVWKIAAGTKAETIRNEETIDLMAAAGCRYISISPETGSPALLKQMRKPFDLPHAVRLVKRMSQAGIRSQACFILGYPGETDSDRRMTRDLVRDLTRQGIDEIALFIITPVPGSAIAEDFQAPGSLCELNFSPTWRSDYRALHRFRLRLYVSFLLWKLRYHPWKVLRHSGNFLRRRFETKMEMTPYRALVFKWLDIWTART
jgi:radical SAM superfamily enzyme YgiQ (UPF0313 family)